MKLNSFKFQDGKVLWLPEYPEEPGYPCLDCTKMDCDAAKCIEKHEEAIAKSLASAIEVAPEDIETVRLMVVKNIYRDGLGQGVKVTSMTQPLPGKVYSAECEMEIKYSWNVEHQNLSSVEKIIGTPKVARLKPKDEIFPAANSHDMKDDDL